MSRTDVSRPIPELSDARWSPRRDGLLALAGGGTFATIVVLMHVVEDEFEPGSRFISEYVLGDWGLLMNVAFIALGGAFLALAHGLRSSLSPGRRVTATVSLLYISGITDIGSGLFNSDSIADPEAGPASWHQILHDLFGFLGMGCVMVALFFLRGVFARDAQWHRLAPQAPMFAIVNVATFVLMMAASTDTIGVAQRVFVTQALLCLGTLACGLVGSESAPPDPAQPQRALVTGT